MFKNGKLVIIVTLLVLMAFLGTMVSCSSSTPTPTATKPVTSAPASAAAPGSTAAPATSALPASSAASGQTINLIITAVGPGGTYDPASRSVLGLADDWSKATGGRVKYTFYPGQALVTAAQTYDATIGGQVDLTWSMAGYNPGRFPLVEGMELPFILPNSALAASQIVQEVYDQFPEIQKEFSEVHFLGMGVFAPRQIMTKNKPVRALEDLKGLKIRISGSSASAIISALGGVPVSMAPGEAYTALQTGTLDGVLWEWGGYATYKLQEVTKYATTVNIQSPAIYFFMNQKKYDNLPADMKKALDDVGGLITAKRNGTLFDEVDQLSLNDLKKSTIEYITLTDTEKAKWVAATKPVTDKWVVDMNAKGLPGQKMLDAIATISKKYK